VFPGQERQLREVRVWLASLLPPCPARDDVVSVATEFGANAIRHTASGAGGTFAVEVAWQKPVVRVAVADGGGTTDPHEIDDLFAENGRGLLLVRGLSARLGVEGDRDGRLVWAEIAWRRAGRARRRGCAAPGDRKARVRRRAEHRGGAAWAGPASRWSA
jgi:hypothetical protein